MSVRTLLTRQDPFTTTPKTTWQWNDGDWVEMPLYGGRRKIRGVLKYLDLSIGGKTWKGLALLGSDSCYYEFVPEIAQRIPKQD